MCSYDVYIIMSWQDWPIVKISLPYIKRNLGARDVVVVSSSKVLKNDLQGCKFLDENEALKESCGITFEAVKNYLESLGSLSTNTGWYLQQFLKLGISKICTDDYYLVWDGDTIPLNPISFFSNKGRPFFTLKREYYDVYFRTIYNLFGIKKGVRESFISEHMLFNTSMTCDMLQRIENDNRYAGENFWQKIFCASDLLKPDSVKKDQRYFSEFETYGTFCKRFYGGFYEFRKLRTLRYGVDFLGSCPNDEILEWASKDFDTISFERWGTPIPQMKKMVEDLEHRKAMSFANTIRKLYRDTRIKIFKSFPHVNHELFAFYLDVLLGKTHFDFFFGNKLQFKTNFWNVLIGRIKRYWTLLTYKF